MLRHIISLLILLCLPMLGAWAQNPNCQTSVYPLSWENGVTQLIAYDSSNASVQSYVWSNGATTQIIEVADYGNYCCTVTYSDGCTASSCYDLGQPCSVFLSNWPDNDGITYHLTSYVYPYFMASGATYLWSNGATTAAINVSAPGTYCVTVTMPTGCTSTACTEVLSQSSGCDFELSYTSNQNQGGLLEAITSGSGTHYYQWSNGESTPNILVFANGEYCCTVSDADSTCQQTKCYTVNDLDSLTCPPVTVVRIGNILQALSFDSTYHAISYLWNTAETSSSISIPSTPAPFYYQVTVTFNNGCTSVAGLLVSDLNCAVSIQYNADNTLTAQPTGDPAAYTYLWAPGNSTSATFAPTTEGYYTVAVTDANGCSAFAGTYWYAPTGCQVNIYTFEDSIPAQQKWLHASTYGNPADWSYVWSDGSTSPTLVAVAPGEYCVTATNLLSGCTASSCFWVQPADACVAEIAGEEVNNTTWELTATGGPSAISTYAWSTGATTSSISTTQAGYYAVTVTNADGCTVSAYYQLHSVKQIVVNVNLTDHSDTTGNGVHARLYLIKYDAAQGGTLTAVDTTDTYSWNDSWALGVFENVSPGFYLVKAALLPGSTGYADYLPTYYTSSLLWSDGTTLQQSALSPYPAPNNVSITLIQGQNPGGPGFIGGLVSEGANFSGGQVDRGEGDPVEGISIVMTLPDGTPVAHATTNAQGQYGFPNLPWGTYVLTIDIPGIAPVSTTVVIGPGQPANTHVNFKVDDNSAAVSSTDDLFGEQGVKVFPNPVTDQFWLESAAGVHAALTNSQGQVMRQWVVSDARTAVSVSDIPAGLYFLTLRTAAAVQTVRVVKSTR